MHIQKAVNTVDSRKFLSCQDGCDMTFVQTNHNYLERQAKASPSGDCQNENLLSRLAHN